MPHLNIQSVTLETRKSFITFIILYRNLYRWKGEPVVDRIKAVVDAVMFSEQLHNVVAIRAIVGYYTADNGERLYACNYTFKQTNRIQGRILKAGFPLRAFLHSPAFLKFAPMIPSEVNIDTLLEQSKNLNFSKKRLIKAYAFLWQTLPIVQVDLPLLAPKVERSESDE